MSDMSEIEKLRQRILELEAENRILTVNLQIQEALRRHDISKGRSWAILATKDDLTGLTNRRAGISQFNIEAQQRRNQDTSSRPDDEPFLVLFIDLDKFGQINKKHGDSAGDEALQRIAKEMQSCLRKDDIIFRKGGDEFIIGLRHIKNGESNQIILDRLAKALDGAVEFYAPSGELISVKGSIGIYTWDNKKTVEENFMAADDQMRKEKNARKQREALENPDFSRIISGYDNITCKLG